MYFFFQTLKLKILVFKKLKKFKSGAHPFIDKFKHMNYKFLEPENIKYFKQN